MKLISADNYKELLYKAAELGQYIIRFEKLKDTLKNKSAEIKQLKKTIRNHENNFKKNKTKENNIEANSTEDEPKVLDAKVNNSI